MTYADEIFDAIPDDDRHNTAADALAFHAAAAAALADAVNAQPVNLHDVTNPKDIAKAITAAVAQDTGHDLRVQYATHMLAIAGERVQVAKVAAATAYQPSFAAAFDATAARLYAQLKALGPIRPDEASTPSWSFDPQRADLRLTLEEMERLGKLRDTYVYLHGAGPDLNLSTSIPQERHSRTAVLDNDGIGILIESRVAAHGYRSHRYFLEVAQMPGARLCWRTPAQQAAQPAPTALRRQRERMAANRSQ